MWFYVRVDKIRNHHKDFETQENFYGNQWFERLCRKIKETFSMSANSHKNY